MEVTLEAGADDIEDQGDAWQVTTAPNAYTAVVDALVKAKIATTSNQMAMVPTMTTKVEGKVAEQVLRLVEALEDHDDVQHVWANFEMDDEAMQAL